MFIVKFKKYVTILDIIAQKPPIPENFEEVDEIHVGMGNVHEFYTIDKAKRCAHCLQFVCRTNRKW